jgi:hypothetical protein
MKNTNFSFLILLLSLMLFSCDSNKNANKEINQTLAQLYEKPMGIYDSIPSNLFSKDLLKKINAVRKITKDDEARIAKSDSPTDKPILFEGSVLSNLYEGFTKYKIQDISINDNQAKATINFENSDFSPSEKWSDTVILVNENGWKLDNVLYARKDSETKDLKENLDSMIKDAKNSKKEK